jgi:PAS domain S-box-containing protein
MKSGKDRLLTPFPLIIMFCIIMLISIWSGFQYYRIQKKNILDSSILELSGITDLKVKQLIQWRHERVSDGLLLSRNLPVVKELKAFNDNPGNKALKKDLLNLFHQLTDETDYKNALLIDTDQRVRLFYPDRDTVIGNYLKPRLKEIERNGEVVLTDLHHTGKVSFVHLDLVVPVRNPYSPDSSVFAVIVLRIDPEKVMFPLIKEWPVKSKSSESFIFNSKDDSIVYLSELKHVSNAQLSYKKSSSEEKLPASMALKGIHKTTDGIDYRGEPVIAAMKQVPESSWYLVAKTDRVEIMEKLNSQIRNVVIIIILINVITFFLSLALWWQRRIGFYRQKFENEKERRALEKHYEFILRFANDIILLINDDFNIIEANDRALETYQYTRNELIGSSLKNLLGRSYEEKFYKTNTERLQERGFNLFEAIHRRKNGEEFPVEASSRKVEIEGVTYYQSIMRDITERKIAEESLKQSEEKFRKVFEDSQIGMVTTDKDMSVMAVNKTFCEMIGYDENDIKGMTFKNFTHPDFIEKDELSLLKLVVNEIPVYRTEKRYLRSDGRSIWGSTTVCIIRNNAGEVNFFLAMVEDISSRKNSEAELEKSLSLLQATIESTAEGILVVDTERNIVLYNQRFSEMWKIPVEVMTLMNDESALNFILDQLTDPEAFVSKVREMYSDHEAVSVDQIEFRDGRIFERFSMPQKVAGKSIGRVWNFRDITHQKLIEKDLIASKEKAEESDRLKTAFLHNISHEIRTPMNAIMGFSALLNEPGVDAVERKQFTEVIFQSGNQLLSIINDVVDLASVESGQVKINLSEVNLNVTLHRIWEQFSYRQIEGKLELQIELPLPDRNTMLKTDETKLIQIISNLVNNAFKFTPSGIIKFGYEKQGNMFEIYVTDTGIGIPHEHISRVFDRFYQVDSNISRQYTGAGLGLSISKAYAELLGGRIWVNSEPGKGTEFRFTIPVMYNKKTTV